MMNNILRLWPQDFKLSKSDIKEVIIVGYGKFGKKAVEKLTSKLPDAKIIVVDSNSGKLKPIPKMFPGVQVYNQDGVEYLMEKPLRDGTWIVPAVPIHLASEWLMMMAKGSGIINFSKGRIPQEVMNVLPNPMEGANGDLYCSFATFFCPDNCSEPENICTHTGKPRKGNLFEVIADAVPSAYRGIIFRSFQLAPGVGGYPASNLITAWNFIREIDIGKSVIVATACRCHGVVTILDA